MKALSIPQELLRQLYLEQELGCVEIAERLKCGSTTVLKYLHKYNIPVRNSSQVQKLCIEQGRKTIKLKTGRGKNNQNWQGGRHKDNWGYFIVYRPDHPKARMNGFILEHRLIWEEYHGRSIPDGWVVHHINGIKDDNSPENLLAVPMKNHSPVLTVKEVQKRLRKVENELRKLKSQSKLFSAPII